VLCVIFLRERRELVVPEDGQLPYYVYILRCKDGSYYTGHAKDVEKRVKMHCRGRGARYTRIHEPEKLVYVEEFDSRGEAMRRERRIKTFSHNKKQHLINNPNKSGSS
jgi:predicted GIY-YIG superfamily endonuclease